MKKNLARVFLIENCQLDQLVRCFPLPASVSIHHSGKHEKVLTLIVRVVESAAVSCACGAWRVEVFSKPRVLVGNCFTVKSVKDKAYGYRGGPVAIVGLGPYHLLCEI